LTAELGELVGDYRALVEDGSVAQADAAGSRLRARLASGLAELDARPVQDESVARARESVERLAGSVERLIADVAAS
jgi:hypothetical protein